MMRWICISERFCQKIRETISSYYYGGVSCENSKLLEKIWNHLPCTLTHLTRVIYSIWIYGKRLEKKLDGNYTRMLKAILNKSWQQHPTRHQLYGHLSPIPKTIQVRWTRYAGHCWRSRDKLISDVLQWTPTYSWAKAGWPAWTYIQQLCEDAGCSPEDLPEEMNDREKWWERVRDIHACGTTWWWWWWWRWWCLLMNEK